MSIFLELNSWGPHSFSRRKKNCRRRFTLPIKSRPRKFRGRAGTAKQMYKKSVLQVQNWFFAYLTIAFLTFSLPSPSSLLKLPFRLYRCKITEVAKYGEKMTLGKCGKCVDR